ncbi:MAG: hypothetical protein K0Q74_139 [Gammaproteobacteria bacterium]|jgi:tetratricopeptide (TPR) repeat protein|nr:hypothetical protein [Gammaproteobacteria bacterium]
MSNKIVFEKDKRLSDSYVWQYQRDYFDRSGIDAWVKDVPHYATSNPFLAACYARMVVRLAQDWARKYPESKKHPFYIIELGTGSGQLSFYVLKNIKRLKKELGIEDLDICYLMTDFTESNLKYWEQHSALKPFLDENRLDFAIFDMERDSTFILKNRGTEISPGSIVNPICVFANYIFDTVQNDAFFSKNGELFDSLITLTTTDDNIVDGKLVELKKAQMSYTMGKIQGQRFEDPYFDAVLDRYRTKLKRSHFLFPTAGLRTIANLKRLNDGKLFLVSTDKGNSTIGELESMGDLFFDHHGSFSLMVNFHVIASYFEESGGKAILQTERDGVTTHAFCAGFDMDELPEFALAVRENVERLSPGDYFVLHRNMRENHEQFATETLVAHLAFAQWDPHIYRRFSKQFSAPAKKMGRRTESYLLSHLPDIAANFYYMPRQYDVFFDLGFLLHSLQKHEEALKYYLLSQQYFGGSFNVFYNLAICYRKSGHKDEAIAAFERALEINPDFAEAEKFMRYLKKGD